MKINKKILVITFSIVLVLITMTIGTYSLFYKEHTATNPSSYSTGLLQIEALSLSDNISLDNALPQTDEDALAEEPYIFSIKNTGNIDYKFNVKLLSTSSNTINPNYIKIKVDDNNPVLLSSLTNSIIKQDIIVKAKESINITLRVWLSIDTPNTEIGKTFTSQIVIDGQSIYTTTNYDPNNNTEQPAPALITLTNLGLSVDTSHTPDFTTVSGNSGVKYVYDATTTDDVESATGLGDGTNGVYVAEDDLGTSYYFRGDVHNNYVYFAKNWWQIIRINGDGTIRMIYTGNPNDSSSQEYISKSAYNSSYNDNAYVGYMYGSAGSSTYEATHANTNDSTIKEVVDTWYQNNLHSYSQYIADAIYCNDREVVNVTYNNGINTTTYNGNGTGTNNTAYASYKRNHIDHNPTLKCTNNNDKFTVSNTLGNGALTNPIGLPTTDEIVMSGANAYDYATRSYIKNNSYYLYPKGGNWHYWTMTPGDFSGGYAGGVGRVYEVGYVDIYFVDSNNAVRPVVSLLSNAISGGDGTMGNPFYVSEAYTS